MVNKRVRMSLLLTIVFCVSNLREKGQFCYSSISWSDREKLWKKLLTVSIGAYEM